MHSRSRNYLCTCSACSQGGNSVWQMEEYVFFVTFAQSITFELIIFVVCMINELSSARVWKAFAETPNNCRIIRLNELNLCWSRSN